MARLRQGKKDLKILLEGDDWENNIIKIANGGLGNVGPLFSFLLLKPEFAHRAARALGALVAEIAKTDPEAARNVVRRYMWHMNEDSGNIGWGIPEAFSETLAASPALAPVFANILMSYIMDLGRADNYCDHDVLRRSCYWAVGRLAQVWPDLAQKSRPWLVKGLADRDSVCRGMAAWALSQLPPDMMDAPALRKLAESGDNDRCEVFVHNQMKNYTVSELAKMALTRDLER